MPFWGVSVMDRKREFVVFAMMAGANIRDLCRRFGSVLGPHTSGLSAIGRKAWRACRAVRRPRNQSTSNAVGDRGQGAGGARGEQQAWGGRKIKERSRAGARPGSGGEHDHRDLAPVRRAERRRGQPRIRGRGSARAAEPERALAGWTTRVTFDAWRRALPSAHRARRSLALQHRALGMPATSRARRCAGSWKKPSASMVCRSDAVDGGPPWGDPGRRALYRLQRSGCCGLASGVLHVGRGIRDAGQGRALPRTLKGRGAERAPASAISPNARGPSRMAPAL